MKNKNAIEIFTNNFRSTGVYFTIFRFPNFFFTLRKNIKEVVFQLVGVPIGTLFRFIIKRTNLHFCSAVPSLDHNNRVPRLSLMT